MNKDEVEKPDCSAKKKTVAEKLASGFHHVKVNFYLLRDGSIIIGGLTFISAGGTCLWNPEEWDYRLGDLIHLPTDCNR